MKLILKERKPVCYLPNYAVVTEVFKRSAGTSDYMVQFFAEYEGIPSVQDGEIVWAERRLSEGYAQPLEVVKIENVPCELYYALRKSIVQPELIDIINQQLEAFNSLFTGTLEGIDIRFESAQLT